MFSFEESKNSSGQFAYRIRNQRPKYISWLIPLWWPVYLLGETLLGFLFFMCAMANTEDAVGFYLDHWEAINDWFLNKNCPT